MAPTDESELLLTRSRGRPRRSRTADPVVQARIAACAAARAVPYARPDTPQSTMAGASAGRERLGILWSPGPRPLRRSLTYMLSKEDALCSSGGQDGRQQNSRAMLSTTGGSALSQDAYFADRDHPRALRPSPPPPPTVPRFGSRCHFISGVSSCKLTNFKAPVRFLSRLDAGFCSKEGQ